MRVEVRLFATLATFLPPHGCEGAALLDVPAGSALGDVVRHLRIPADVERVCLVNGESADPDRPLREGDIVTLFPPLAGGRD